MATRTAKRAIGFDKQNNNFARTSRFFAHFFLPSLHDYDVKMPDFTFYGGREHKTTIFFFFCELRYSLLEFNSLKIANKLKELEKGR